MESRLLFLLCVFGLILLSKQQSLQDAINDNSIYMQFDSNGELLVLEDWERVGATANFKDITAMEATTYCRDDLDSCDLVALNSTFDSGDVGIVEGPESYNGKVRLRVYITLDGKNVKSDEAMVLPKATLKTIVTEAMDVYNSSLAGEDSKEHYSLMFVDGERVAPPLDNSINYIMIGVSILILLTACFLALVLKCKESMEDKKRLQVASNDPDAGDHRSGGENLTLTAIKPATDDDSKEPSEGPVKV